MVGKVEVKTSQFSRELLEKAYREIQEKKDKLPPKKRKPA